MNRTSYHITNVRDLRQGHVGRGVLLLLLAGASLLLFACSSNNNNSGNSNNKASGATAAPNYGTITIAAGQPLTIGLSTALSGGAATLGKPIANGGELAVTQKATIKGFPVKIDIEDDACGGPGSVAVANKLISDPSVVAVVGPMCSSGCVPAEQVYASKHIVSISPSCTGVAVTQQGFDDILRDVPSDSVQGAGQAKFAKDTLQAKKAFLVDDQSIYAQGLKNIFKQNFADSSHSIAKEASIKVGDTDFSAIVTQIQSSGADLICFYGFIPEGTLLIQQIRKAGINTTFMGGDGINDPDGYIKASQGASEGTYVTEAVTGTTPATAKFAADYKAKYSIDPGTYSDTAFDGANLLMQAIESTATVQGGKLVIDKAALIAAVHKANYSGVTGSIQFGSNGDRSGGATVNVSKVVNGAFVKQASVTP